MSYKIPLEVSVATSDKAFNSAQIENWMLLSAEKDSAFPKVTP